jgi:hypothetical protein
MPVGRRQRAKQDKRERIMGAARELFAERGVSVWGLITRSDVRCGVLPAEIIPQ